MSNVPRQLSVIANLVILTKVTDGIGGGGAGVVVVVLVVILHDVGLLRSKFLNLFSGWIAIADVNGGMQIIKFDVHLQGFDRFNALAMPPHPVSGLHLLSI